MNNALQITALNILLFFLCLSIPANVFGESVFVSGTYAGDTRYDVKKTAYGAEGSPDQFLCWAASASNNLQLWQDNLAKSGYNIPPQIPNGKTQDLYSTDIFYIFANNWKDEAGCSTFAYQWYLTGKYDPSYSGGAEASVLLPDAIPGGYWSFLGLDMDAIVERINCQAGSAMHPVEGSENLLKEAINTVFNNGWMASLTVSNWGGHSVTLVGYEFDPASDELTGLWICDSDNPNTNSNVLIDIYWSEGYQAWIFGDAHIDESDIVSDYDNLKNWIIMSMDVFKAPMQIPEPSTYALLFGVIVLFFAHARRKM